MKTLQKACAAILLTTGAVIMLGGAYLVRESYILVTLAGLTGGGLILVGNLLWRNKVWN